MKNELDESLAATYRDDPDSESGRAAARELFERYRERVYLWCARRVRNREEALDLARMTASRLGPDAVQLVRSDLFEKITGRYDLVTANLPYIPSAEIPALSREVRRDPVLALDGGPDGMDIIRRFLVEVQPCLQSGALVVLEVGHDQGREVAALAASQGFTEIRVLPDLADIERFVLAIAPPMAETAASEA